MVRWTGGMEGNSSRKSFRWDCSGSCRLSRGQILGHAVEDHDAVAQMDMVAGNADQPLHQDQVLRIPIAVRIRHRLEEDHDVAALRLAVVNQRHPLGGRGKVMRSTTRWSPTSSVFSIEPEGMTKFWPRKVRMNRPITRMEQMLASASEGVSSTRSSDGLGWAGVRAASWGRAFFSWSSCRSVSVLSSFTVNSQSSGVWGSLTRILLLLFTDLCIDYPLMHYVEDALPAGKALEPGREGPVVSESIIRGL